MFDKDWIVTISELSFAVAIVIALLFKMNWLIAALLVIAGIIGILAAIFKWEEILFYSHF